MPFYGLLFREKKEEAKGSVFLSLSPETPQRWAPQVDRLTKAQRFSIIILKGAIFNLFQYDGVLLFSPLLSVCPDAVWILLIPFVGVKKSFVFCLHEFCAVTMLDTRVEALPIMFRVEQICP
ncbi:hypothetical protein FQA47_013712 [Oryzias melastigma]|uniref:Uncharacterized protein n=1 Tax=Oryzias melastigma TaxID=30732 RepID=A0A834FGQ3_ORYME|nr:hypothetical protein FQA47_013712 [Oryzias melastigma]